MANGQYHGTIPNIAQAFQNDPRTKLAANALMTGTSSAPVAGGGWAWADGLSRIGQALLGAHMNKQQEKRYSTREEEYLAAMQQAAAASAPPAMANPAVANPANVNPSGYEAAAGALGGPQRVPQPGAIQPVDLPPSVPAQAAMASPTGAGAVNAPMPPDAALAALRGQPTNAFPMVEGPAPMPPRPSPPMAGGTGPNRGAAPTVSMYFRNGIVPIEGGTDRNGKFLTSPKGAYGPSQLMPATAPEALALAGFSRDDPRWRTDAEVNLKAGEAYYAKQLETFGDPVKAAAAYNAGPGRVQRAIRRAARDGGEWTQYLPDETKKYIVNFQEKVGAAAQGQATQANVPTAEMEPVPDAPQAPGARPQAPQLPQQIQTNRIAMAQQMLNSGNPDLVVIAQSYLDKGLDEQQQARVIANNQEFQQGQTGYDADLGDWAGARSDDRSFRYGEVRDAKQRNFTRGERQAGQEFQAGESALDRQYGTAERRESQQFQAAQAEKDRAFQRAERNAQNEWEYKKAEAEALRKQQSGRNPYWDTTAGLALREKVRKERDSNEWAIGQYQRFIEINKETPTGGAGAYLYPWLPFSTNIDELNKIADDTTLAKIGGSLGAGFSNADRDFIQSSNVSTKSMGSTNINVARARVAALRRTNDYLYERAEAEGEGRNRQFEREWRLFAETQPLSRDGKLITDEPMTFQEWRASRKRYDANGREIR